MSWIGIFCFSEIVLSCYQCYSGPSCCTAEFVALAWIFYMELKGYLLCWQQIWALLWRNVFRLWVETLHLNCSLWWNDGIIPHCQIFGHCLAVKPPSRTTFHLLLLFISTSIALSVTGEMPLTLWRQTDWSNFASPIWIAFLYSSSLLADPEVFLMLLHNSIRCCIATV